MGGLATPWSHEEVEATVASYFRMLMHELAGNSYNKAEHRRALMKMLNGRTEPAVELKHANISAILIELGCPFIRGYKPRSNYQSLLFDVVEARVGSDTNFNRVAVDAVERPATPPVFPAGRDIVEDPPSLRLRAEVGAGSYQRSRVAVKRDYLAREARNRALGLAGEKFVVDFERTRLALAGKDRLAADVVHVSKERGDGLGYDVLSFDPSGRERFIEVKTTAFGKETPFYLSQGEVDF